MTDLQLLMRIRQVAYDPSLWHDPADQMRRIRDLYLEWDEAQKLYAIRGGPRG